METPQNEHDLLQLISRVQDGQATTEDCAWLEKSIEIDSRIRCAYLEIVDLESELVFFATDRQTPTNDHSERPLLVDLESVFAVFSQRSDATKPIASPADEVVPASKLTRAWERGYDFVSNYTTLSLVVSGLFFAILLLSMAQIVPDWKRFVPNSKMEGPSVEFVAHITDTQNATFDEMSERSWMNLDLFEDDRVVLKSGLVVITYDTGARVVLEGPATYQIQGPNGGNLRRGKLVVQADTPQSSGFTIDLPNARVVDLGTEFAVDVLADGAANIAVLSGQVDLVGSANQQRIQLTKNQAASVAANSGAIARLDGHDVHSVISMRNQLRMLHPPVVVFAEGFESPVQPPNTWKQANGNGKGTLSGCRWTVSEGAGITRNLSAFQREVPAPEGQQHALIQNGGFFKQTVTDFSVGKHYTLNLKAMARQMDGDGGNDLEVVLDAGQPTEIVLLDLAEVSFDRFTDVRSPPFQAIKDAYELTIRVTRDGGRLEGDRTTLFDAVVLMESAMAFRPDTPSAELEE